MKEPSRRIGDPASPSSRRRSVRLEAPDLTIELEGRVTGQVIGIGLGGVGLLTARPVRKGATYRIGLRLHGVVVSCYARSAHCRRREDGNWIVGLAFVMDEHLAAVEQFVDAITREQIEFS